MNDVLQDYARQVLIDGLLTCTPDQQMIFKRMYSHKNLEASIEEVVAGMKDTQLDWAMQQVAKTVQDNSTNNT